MIKNAVVGEPLGFSLDVTVDNPADVIDVSGIRFNGQPLAFQVADVGTSSARVIINGRVVQDSSGSRRRYTFTLPSDKPGRYIVPAGNIVIAGNPYKIPVLQFTVTEAPTSDDLLFKTTLVRQQASYYPSEEIEVLCKLYYRNLQDIQRESITLPMLDDARVQLIPEATESVLEMNGRRVPVSAKQGSELFNGRQYQTFSFSLRFRLLKPGMLHYTNSFKVGYNSGEYQMARDFFGRQVRQAVRTPLYGTDTLSIVVKPLPQQNVPETFNGAIGDFTIKAIPSTDTDVRVGDPITLSLEVRGTGTWDLVQCPPLDRVQGLTDFFKLGEDLPIGEVAADGTAKTFAVRMRVKSATVTQIPPIPFTYFNIRDQAYKTVYSEPVPIKVYDSGRAARIVDYTAEPPAPTPGQIQAPTPPAVDLGQAIKPEGSEPTVEGPAKPPPIRISPNAEAALLVANHAPAFRLLTLPGIGFVLALAAFFFKTMTQTAPSPEKLRKLKAKGAYAAFRKATGHLASAGSDESGFYRDLGRAVRTFACDRFAIEGELDERTVAELAAAGRLSKEKCAALRSLTEEIDHLRYSSEKFDPAQGKKLLAKAQEVLKSC